MLIVQRFVFSITRTARVVFSVCLFIFFALSNARAENIHFTANKMRGNTNENSRFTRLSGNAHIQTESIEIYADDILLDGDDFRYITASGNVHGTNIEAGFDFTCQSMKYDRTEKIALLERNVTLDDAENDVKANAQIIEYKQETETAVMQAGVSITQKKSVCTAAVAVYRKAEQMLELIGNPKVVQEEDTFIAQEITMNLETEEITLYGKVRGFVADSTEDNSQTAEESEAASTTDDGEATTSAAEQETTDDGEATTSAAEQKATDDGEAASPENSESTETDGQFQSNAANNGSQDKQTPTQSARIRPRRTKRQTHDENGDKHE